MIVTDPFHPLFLTAKELLREEGNDLASSIMVAENVDLMLKEHDNWDGGIDYYGIEIVVSIKQYVKLKKSNSIESLEKEIAKAFEEASVSDESIHFSNAVIQPSTSTKEAPSYTPVDVSFWTPGYFKVFISHLTADKVQAAQLKERLKAYGISCFVAHEDIQVSKAWHEEIIKALMSMDCLIAIVSEGFINSTWCDQEVGFGLGRGVLCIPISKGVDPYGLLGRFQALKAKGKYPIEIAEEVFRTVSNDEKTRLTYQRLIAELFLASSTKDLAKSRLDLILKIPHLQKDSLTMIKQHFSENEVLKNDNKIVESVNKLLKANGLDPIQPMSALINDDEDLPF